MRFILGALTLLVSLSAFSQRTVGNGAGSSEFMLQSAYQAYAVDLKLLLQCSVDLSDAEIALARKFIQNSPIENGGLIFDTTYDALAYTFPIVGSPIYINIKILNDLNSKNARNLFEAEAYEIILGSLKDHLNLNDADLANTVVTSLAYKISLSRGGHIQKTDIVQNDIMLASILTCSVSKRTPQLFIINTDQKVAQAPLNLSTTILNALDCKAIDHISFLNPISKIEPQSGSDLSIIIRFNTKYRCDGKNMMGDIIIDLLKTNYQLTVQSIESKIF